MNNSIADYKTKVDRLYAIKGEIDKLETEKKALNDQILAMLLEEGLATFHGETCKVSVITKERVATPKAINDKQSFFKWLEEKNLFWELATVNSNSLNALYKNEKEISEGDFSIPGIATPYEYTSLQVRKK